MDIRLFDPVQPFHQSTLLEDSVWLLISRLVEHRLSPDPSTTTNYDNNKEPSLKRHPFSSDLLATQTILNLQPLLSELQIIKTWLEDCAPPLSQSDTLPATSTISLKSLSHPDTPDSSLSKADTLQLNTIHKRIFHHLRRGDLVAAQQYCQDIGHPWIPAILSGPLLFEDPLFDNNSINNYDDVDGNLLQTSNNSDSSKSPERRLLTSATGNINRPLFKYVCHQLSSDTSRDIYERATLAVLAGQSKNALPVCHSWEDMLWVYISAWLESEIDSILASKSTLISSLPDFFSSSASVKTTPSMISSSPSFLSEKRTLSQIFTILASVDDPIDIKESARNPFRIIQMYIMLDQIQELYQIFRASMYNIKFDQSNHSSTEPLEIADAYHFIVHLIIALRAVGYQVKGDAALTLKLENDILSQYVRLLTVTQQNDKIALYCSKLPSELQIETFSDFLKLLRQDVDKNLKFKYLQEANEYGLPIHQIAMETVRHIVSEIIVDSTIEEDNEGDLRMTSAIDSKTSQITLVFPGVPIQNTDRILIESLEWLMYRKAWHANLLHWSNALARRFLAKGKVNAVAILFSSLPTDLIASEWVHQMSISETTSLLPHQFQTAQDTQEHLVLKDLLSCIELYDQWCRSMSEQPPNTTSMARVSREYSTWKNRIMKESQEAEHKLRSFLSAQHFVDIEDESARARELGIVREIYFPQLVMWVQEILMSTAQAVSNQTHLHQDNTSILTTRSNLELCIELVNDIARDDRLLREMKITGLLSRFLDVIATASIQTIGHVGKDAHRRSTLPWSSL